MLFSATLFPSMFVEHRCCIVLTDVAANYFVKPQDSSLISEIIVSYFPYKRRFYCLFLVRIIRSVKSKYFNCCERKSSAFWHINGQQIDWKSIFTMRCRPNFLTIHNIKLISRESIPQRLFFDEESRMRSQSKRRLCSFGTFKKPQRRTTRQWVQKIGAS